MTYNPSLPTTISPQPTGHLALHTNVNTAVNGALFAQNNLSDLQSLSAAQAMLGISVKAAVTPSGATYTATLGDRAGVTLGTTTSAILPVATTTGAGVSDIIIGCVAGTGTCNVTVSGGGSIVGPSGSVTSLAMAAIGTIFTFQVLGGIWTAR